MKSKILKKSLPDFNGEAWLIKLKTKYYVVSHIDKASDTGSPETLVFLSKEGKTENFEDID
jgi:hypothetical protein